MSQTYILVDTSNLFFRARWAMSGDADSKVGMALHVVLGSIRKVWSDFNGSHVVFFNEGKSWRKQYYPPYKAQRAAKRAAMTPIEQAEEEMFWETLDEFNQFITDKTNCTVMQHPNLEADDLIAGFIQSHPSDKHVIVSTDADYLQLLADNVFHYNGVADVLTTIYGYIDAKGNPVLDKKTNEPKPAPNPEWLLFEKCMRGDTSDNIFTAFPRVRTKGTKNKVGLIEAFEDRLTQGWAWNNLMNQTWDDHTGVTHIVKDDYERNRILIDLSAQPDDIKIKMFETIIERSVPKNVQQVGIHFLKFCGKHDLKTIANYSQSYIEPLSAKYC